MLHTGSSFISHWMKKSAKTCARPCSALNITVIRNTQCNRASLTLTEPEARPAIAHHDANALPAAALIERGTRLGCFVTAVAQEAANGFSFASLVSLGPLSPASPRVQPDGQAKADAGPVKAKKPVPPNLPALRFVQTGSLPFFPCDRNVPCGHSGLVRLFHACHQAAMGAAGTSTKETSIWLRTRTPLPLQLRPHRQRHRLTSRTKSEIAKAARASGLASAVHGRTATARASTSSLNACRSTVASRSVSLLTRKSDCSTRDGRVVCARPSSFSTKGDSR